MVNAKITQYPTTNNPHRPLYLWQFSIIDNYSNTVIMSSIKWVGGIKYKMNVGWASAVSFCRTVEA
jgi:hypothetical protein